MWCGDFREGINIDLAFDVSEWTTCLILEPREAILSDSETPLDSDLIPEVIKTVSSAGQGVDDGRAKQMKNTSQDLMCAMGNLAISMLAWIDVGCLQLHPEGDIGMYAARRD